MNKRFVIGLASGSSVDGVDAVLAEIQGIGLDMSFQPLLALHQPYARDLRDLLQRVGTQGQLEMRSAALLHRLLGETFAAAARQVADRASMSLQEVQCLGCAGHTIWHEPEGRFPSTFALGMSATIAERTGVTTISDFRARDLALGGQGVPLAALADYLLFHSPSENRTLIHLGGLARIVHLPAGGRPHSTIGFEAVACNLLLDGLIRRLTGGREQYDPGGKNGVQGRCLDALLERWLAHPYLQRRPPKSVPRHCFAAEFIAQSVPMARQQGCSVNDLLCTATHFVARAIAGAVRRFLPLDTLSGRALVSGGGARNGLLWRLLEQQLQGTTLEKTDCYGVSADARKALGFGVLAALTVDGVPANLPSATGASGSRLLGNITPGSSANWARCLAWMAAETAPLAMVA
ncbi:MAG: anhydro-N-acetylmuramic acid kinase [Planctomycetota bacterium]|nr:MAG: anhydro-N-acetylmuramic acid kinase [Planctomycetota bacterium]